MQPVLPDIKSEIAAAVCRAGGPDLDIDTIKGFIEVPPDTKLGDFALPCFKLSKIMKKSPALIAEDLSSKIERKGYIAEVTAVSGYLNIKLNDGSFVKSVVDTVLAAGPDFGRAGVGEGKTVVIDYSAPNIAKPFHIGHLSTTVIGAALYRIYGFLGYKCVGINHLGDWGTQFGKLIVAFKRWSSLDLVDRDGIKELVRIYVKYHQEAEENPALDDEAREWFVKIEAGNEEAIGYWKHFKDISLKEFEKTYDLLGIKFDSYAGESFYNDKMAPVIAKLEEKGLLEESEGARIVKLDDHGMPPSLILKKDGSTLYATRDLAAAIYRHETYDFYKCLYVTGATQSLHFKQLFKVLELMGYEWAGRMEHVAFGTIDFAGEKIATRKGNMVLLEDIFNKSIEKTLEIIETKNPNLENKSYVAEKIGVGAVIFNNLSSGRIKDISFRWEDVLNFDGETGPYVQYAHARACSVLEKGADKHIETFDPSRITEPEELSLVKLMYDFRSRLLMAAEENEPSVITRYIIDLAQAFNKFYHSHTIISDDAQLTAARLALTKAVKFVLATALELIGLAPLEKV